MPAIYTVLGPIAPEALGRALTHEHILCDFIGAEETGPHRWDRDDVVTEMLPYLEALRPRGFTGFVDCSPQYLGRDPLLLKQLSELSGLHILTNTGLYKAPYLPHEVQHMTVRAIAERWIDEWQKGIGDTGIRPGFVKIAVNPGPLIPIQRDIVRAAAQTHLATDLTVMAHTAHAVAANEGLDLIEEEGMDPARYIIAHADKIDDPADHRALADRGAWLGYDGVGLRPLDEHVVLIVAMLEAGYRDRLLLSQDAGWYRVGEPHGGATRPYTTLGDELVPALRERGVDPDTLDRLLIVNPRRAFSAGE